MPLPLCFSVWYEIDIEPGSPFSILEWRAGRKRATVDSQWISLDWEFSIYGYKQLKPRDCLLGQQNLIWVDWCNVSPWLPLCLVWVCSVAQLCPTLGDPRWTVACQASLSTGFSRQEYWRGLPFPTLGDPPDRWIEPASWVSCIGRWILYHCTACEAPCALYIATIKWYTFHGPLPAMTQS